MKKVMNLKDLKRNMWIEVCEGDDSIEMSDEFKKLVSEISDEEVNGVMYVFNFYKLLDILIDNDLIEFEGGEQDWCVSYLDEYGEGDNFNVYYLDYLKLAN
jgi:hypothetical protein